MNDNTMTHSPGCTRPDPWRDRFKPGWIRLKCPECQHIANVTEAALFNQDNAKALTPTPTSGYRCREHHDQEVTPKGRGCVLCSKTKRKAPEPSDDYEMEY